MRYSIQSGKTVEEATQKALDELRISRKDAIIEVIEEPSKGFFGLLGGKDAIVKVSKNIDNRDLLDEIFDEELFTEKATSVVETPKRERASQKKKKDKKKPFEEKVVEEEKKEPKVVAEPVVEKTTNQFQEEARETVEEPSTIHTSARKAAKSDPMSNREAEEKIRTYFSHLMDAFGLEYDLTIQMDTEEIRVNINGDQEKMGIIIGKRGITLDSIQHILSLIINRNSDSFRRVIVDTSNYREKREETLQNLAQKMANKALRSNRPIKLEPMDARERRIIHAALTEVSGITTYSEGRDPYRRVVITKERKND